MSLLSLEQAFASRADMHAIGETDEFPPGWIPMASVDDGYLVMDCAAGSGEGSAPIYRVNFELGNTRAAGSVGEVVDFWIECLQSGAWAWNRQGYWDWDPDRLPAHPHALDLV